MCTNDIYTAQILLIDGQTPNCRLDGDLQQQYYKPSVQISWIVTDGLQDAAFYVSPIHIIGASFTDGLPDSYLQFRVNFTDWWPDSYLQFRW